MAGEEGGHTSLVSSCEVAVSRKEAAQDFPLVVRHLFGESEVNPAPIYCHCGGMRGRSHSTTVTTAQCTYSYMCAYYGIYIWCANVDFIGICQLRIAIYKQNSE